LFVFINPNPPSVGTGLPNGWSVKGCIAEPNGGRALSFDATSLIPAADLTNELCASTCSGLNYTMSGAEYGSQCMSNILPTGRNADKQATVETH
jgi:hypothetical protein